MMFKFYLLHILVIILIYTIPIKCSFSTRKVAFVPCSSTLITPTKHHSKIINLAHKQNELNNIHTTTETLPDPDFPYATSSISSLLKDGLNIHSNSHIRSGFSDHEVQSRLKIYGYNRLKPPTKKSLWEMWINQFDDTLVKILLAVAMVSTISSIYEAMNSYDEANDASNILKVFIEPFIIILILIINAIVGVWQELSAAGSLEALQNMQPRTATVLRKIEDGPKSKSEWLVGSDASTLVPGDVVQIKVGDFVPADIRIVELETSTLSIDESSLTGESCSVYKLPGDEANHEVNDTSSSVGKISITEQKEVAFAGTMVVSGTALGLVIKTGMGTEIGKLASATVAVEERKTPLAEKLDSFGNDLSRIIALICAGVWVASIPHFTDPSFSTIFDGALYYAKVGVALGVAAIPEGLPAVITLCLALGTRRMAERNVIVRKLPSVETLGCTSVICTDKTGTLTTNQMTVVSVLMFENNAEIIEHFVSGDSYDPIGAVDGVDDTEISDNTNGSVSYVYLVSKLCNNAKLVSKDVGDGKVRIGIMGEPTEGSLLVFAEKIHKSDVSTSIPQWERCATFEFDRKRKSMSVLCKMTDNNNGLDKFCLFVKGAPNLLLDRCSNVKLRSGEIVAMNPELRKSIENTITSLSKRPLRCLLLATKEVPDPENYLNENVLTDSSNFASVESNLTVVGCVGIKDPARKEVKASINQCKKAGIRVVMITGDALDTAIAIARDINIFTEEDLLSMEGVKAFDGKEFFKKTKNEQLALLEKGNLVFARTEPIDKQNIVKLLQSLKEIPAMTGDGVNDAPALTQASIGIAMGTGTDVAKEAADMVLVDDSFTSIVNGVEEGRCIYANMQAFINFLISCNIGEVFAVFIATALGYPNLLSAMHLLWVNLVTDGPPATALGFNPPDQNIMNRQPRSSDEEIITPWLLTRYVVIGAYIGFATVGIFTSQYLSQGVSMNELRSWSLCSDWNDSSNGISCDDLFGSVGLALPQTLALTTLVTTELLKALCTVSVDTSIFDFGPQKNPYLLLGVAFPFSIHLAIVYSDNLGLPFLRESFGLAPLTLHDWMTILSWSFPIILVEEILKAINRQRKTG